MAVEKAYSNTWKQYKWRFQSDELDLSPSEPAAVYLRVGFTSQYCLLLTEVSRNSMNAREVNMCENLYKNESGNHRGKSLQCDIFTAS